MPSGIDSPQRAAPALGASGQPLVFSPPGQAPFCGRFLSNARTQVEVLRRALLSSSPEEIERCLPGLEDAVRCLTIADKDLPNYRSEFNALSTELRIVQRLIVRGAAFYRGWAEMLGAAAAGYMPTGEAAPIARLFDGAASVSIRG